MADVTLPAAPAAASVPLPATDHRDFEIVPRRGLWVVAVILIAVVVAIASGTFSRSSHSERRDAVSAASTALSAWSRSSSATASPA